MTSPDATAPASGSATPIPASDLRLEQLTAELDGHARTGRDLGVDFQRAVRALDDGYPDTAVAQVGKITERLLKQSQSQGEELRDGNPDPLCRLQHFEELRLTERVVAARLGPLALEPGRQRLHRARRGLVRSAQLLLRLRILQKIRCHHGSTCHADLP